MVTLLDYAARRFPNRSVEVDAMRTKLTRHTAVAHLDDEALARTIATRLRHERPGADVGLAVLRPASSATMRDEGDAEGIVDLPVRRPFTIAVVLGIVLGLCAALVAFWQTDSTAAAVVAGALVAVIAGVAGMALGGGARLGGERAWQQQRHADEDIWLVAVYAATEADAADVTQRFEQLGARDVRIVDDEGAWHVPAR